MSKLPQNCEIEVLDPPNKSRDFQLRFYAQEGEDYVSEVYTPAKGQRLKAAALEVCQRYGWLEFPPATGILTEEQLTKLETMVEDAIHDMEENPARYVPDPEEAWNELFAWADSEFMMDGDDLLACGDPSMPVQDGDGWTTEDRTHDIGRAIPKSVRGVETDGVRGIELVRFRSVDSSGDCETEALFVRHQPGAKITPQDRSRARMLTARSRRLARVHADATDADSRNKAWRAWTKASSKARAAALLDDGGVQEECWDPEEFQYYAAQMNCFWTLLHHKHYEIWCALHGEDPLERVGPEWVPVAGVFDVTVHHRDAVDAKRISGHQSLLGRAIRYVGRNTAEELHALFRETPEGRRATKADRGFNLSRMYYSWEPVSMTLDSATIRVGMEGRQAMPMTALRIRQVSCRGLEEDVKRLLGQIESNYPIK